MTSPRSKAKLIEGPVASRLIKLALPMVVGIVAILLFSVVDTYFVSKLGTAELAAMGFTFPVTLILMNFSMGLGIGTTTAVSHVVGAGDHERAQKVTTYALLLGLAAVTVIGGFAFFFQRQIFMLLGAEGEVLRLIQEYMTVWLAGIGLLVIPMVGNAAIRATGDTMAPATIMLMAALANLILDPLLIFGWYGFPRLEIQGAAIATVASWGIAFLASFYFLGPKKDLLLLKVPSWTDLRQVWGDILYVGLPASLTNLLTPLSTAVLTAFMAYYGKEAVAAFGVGGRVEPVALVAVIGLSTALSAFVGQNMGAGRRDRVDTALSFSFRFSVIWGLVLVPFLIYFSTSIGELFSDEAPVLDVLFTYFLIVPIGFGLEGVTMLACTAFNAVKRPFDATFLNLLRLFILTIPFAFIGSCLGGVKGVFIGTALANLVSGCVSYWWVQRRFPKEIKLAT